MAHPVVIENEALRMEVWPALGGKVASLVDKADGFELLFNYPAEIPTSASYDTSYAKNWCAGWDECFPAVAASRYAGHPYDGIAVPDHGELWGLPTTAVPTRDGITTVWHGLRFGYRLTRKLYLDGPTARAEYTLINLAPFDFRFVWAMHPLLAMDGAASDVELSFGNAGPDVGDSPFTLSHDAEHASPPEAPPAFAWPTTPGGEELSRPAALPPRRAWKAFSTKRASSPATVTYPARGRRLTVQCESADVVPYWGVWVNTGGWGGHRHFSVQPTTGRFDQIDRSVRDGSAGRVEAAGRCEWSAELTVRPLA